MSKSIFIVLADDHDYDCMSSWTSDYVYWTKEEADAEMERMQKAYWKKHKGSKKRGFPNIDVVEFTIWEKAND